MKNLPALLLMLMGVPAFAQQISNGLTAVYNDRQQTVSLKWNHIDGSIVAYKLQRGADESSWQDVAYITPHCS